jgi:hypothetical protein
MASSALECSRIPRAAWWPGATVLIVILVILAVTAGEGWALPDVITLVIAVTAAAGLSTRRVSILPIPTGCRPR